MINQNQEQSPKENPPKTPNILPSDIEETSLPKNPLKIGEKYIPPYKMNKIIEEIRTKNNTKSEEYQKIMWDLLSKSINGIVNKVNDLDKLTCNYGYDYDNQTSSPRFTYHYYGH